MIKALPVNPNTGSDAAFANSQFLVQGHDVSAVSNRAGKPGIATQ